jgi:uncharacterized membrane protein (UPF0127 family)
MTGRGSVQSRAVLRRAACLALLMAGAAIAQPAAPRLDTAAVTLAGERFTLEIARDPAVQFKGLGGRMSIPPDGGMLFVFGAPRETAFVMRDCPIPIDVAYVDSAGRVISIHEMRPEPARAANESLMAYESRLKQYPSGAPALYAIETAGGRMREIGLRAGDLVELDRDALLRPAP